MRRVAGEQQAAVTEFLHAPALERVDARPLDLELRVGSEHGAKTRQDALRLLFQLGIGVPPELEVDAPDVVGLPMQQHRLVRMERRVEPEPPLGRKIRLHVNVGDEKAVAKRLPFEVETQHVAHRTARAVAHEQPVARQPVIAIVGGHAQRHAVGVRRDAADLVPPANLERRQRLRALHEALLEVVLLQVDEGRPVMSAFRQQVELVRELAALIDLAHAPAHALARNGLAASQAIEDLQRPLRIADRARAHAHRVVVVEHEHRDPALGQVDRGDQPHRPGADDDHLAMARRPVELGRAPVFVRGVGVGFH